MSLYTFRCLNIPMSYTLDEWNTNKELFNARSRFGEFPANMNGSHLPPGLKTLLYLESKISPVYRKKWVNVPQNVIPYTCYVFPKCLQLVFHAYGVHYLLAKDMYNLVSCQQALLSNCSCLLKHYINTYQGFSTYESNQDFEIYSQRKHTFLI